MKGTSRAAGLILAAGRSTRFGSDKLAASFHGRSLLQHVVDAAVDAGLSPIVVVLSGPRESVDWRGARPVINPDPDRGLSSSLRVGLEALAAESDADRVAVLLGDQPLVSGAVIGQLLDDTSGRPIVVPRYADAKPGNPVILARAAWPLAQSLTGDRGMSQLFDGRPDLVHYVRVPGTNPDIDTPADLSLFASGYRLPTELEKGIILRLLETPFPGRDELRLQLELATVQAIDPEGSLSIRTTSAVRADVVRRVPVEAEAVDTDRMKIHYLLHVLDGVMDELEIYKDDSTSIIRPPRAEDLTIILLE